MGVPALKYFVRRKKNNYFILPTIDQSLSSNIFSQLRNVIKGNFSSDRIKSRCVWSALTNNVRTKRKVKIVRRSAGCGAQIKRFSRWEKRPWFRTRATRSPTSPAEVPPRLAAPETMASPEAARRTSSMARGNSTFDTSRRPIKAATCVRSTPTLWQPRSAAWIFSVYFSLALNTHLLFFNFERRFITKRE